MKGLLLTVLFFALLGAMLAATQATSVSNWFLSLYK